MKKAQGLLISVTAFLLVWFYVQPFAKDVDQIVDDLVYTKAEQNYDMLQDSIAKEMKKLNDSLAIELEELIKKDDSIYKTIK
jgi:hypothetical protein